MTLVVIDSLICLPVVEDFRHSNNGGGNKYKPFATTPIYSGTIDLEMPPEEAGAVIINNPDMGRTYRNWRK